MPAPSDTERTADILAAALAEANARPPFVEFSFMPDGEDRSLAGIEARAREMKISSGPGPLTLGPQRAVPIAPPTSSTAAPESKSDISNGNEPTA